MKISGFTFLRNTSSLYYPVRESLLSILDFVDELVIALGDNDPDDRTLELLESLNSPKIRIINTVWDLQAYKFGTEYAHQTDIAKEACTGDWLFYVQGDEVIHEEDLPEIRQACEKYLDKPEVEGFVFNYLHFFGDYEHYFSDHCWYKKEIRIVRTRKDIHSWRDAQSFRVSPDFKGDYLQHQGTQKLSCIALKARVFHYGWVRPPELMQKKQVTAVVSYSGSIDENEPEVFDYGRLDRCKVFTGTHPRVMEKKISTLHWKDKLRFSGPDAIGRKLMKHEKPKYRILSWIEENLLGGYVIGGFKNYKLL